jgi:hypothetical protein
MIRRSIVPTKPHSDAVPRRATSPILPSSHVLSFSFSLSFSLCACVCPLSLPVSFYLHFSCTHSVLLIVTERSRNAASQSRFLSWYSLLLDIPFSDSPPFFFFFLPSVSHLSIYPSHGITVIMRAFPHSTPQSSSPLGSSPGASTIEVLSTYECVSDLSLSNTEPP